MICFVNFCETRNKDSNGRKNGGSINYCYDLPDYSITSITILNVQRVKMVIGNNLRGIQVLFQGF